MVIFNLAQDGLVEIREDYVEEDSNKGESKSGMLLPFVTLQGLRFCKMIVGIH